jgi:hypothetical protein
VTHGTRASLAPDESVHTTSVYMLTRPPIVGETVTRRIWHESYHDVGYSKRQELRESRDWQAVQVGSAGGATP